MEAKLDQINNNLSRHISSSAEKYSIFEANQNFIIQKLLAHDEEFADARNTSASSFAAVDGRFDRALDMMRENFRLMNRRIDQGDTRFEDMEDRFDKVDQAIERLDIRLQKAEANR